VRLEAGTPEGANPAAREDQVGCRQAIVRLSACLRSTSVQTP
jgi:hypothetical protein